MEHIGKRIKERREKLGLSQKDMGIKISVSQQAIDKWEKGYSSPQSDIIPKIAECLDTTPNFLFGFENSKIIAEKIYRVGEKYKSGTITVEIKEIELKEEGYSRKRSHVYSPSHHVDDYGYNVSLEIENLSDSILDIDEKMFQLKNEQNSIISLKKSYMSSFISPHDKIVIQLIYTTLDNLSFLSFSKAPHMKFLLGNGVAEYFNSECPDYPEGVIDYHLKTYQFMSLSVATNIINEKSELLTSLSEAELRRLLTQETIDALCHNNLFFSAKILSPAQPEKMIQIAPEKIEDFRLILDDTGISRDAKNSYILYLCSIKRFGENEFIKYATDELIAKHPETLLNFRPRFILLEKDSEASLLQKLTSLSKVTYGDNLSVLPLLISQRGRESEFYSLINEYHEIFTDVEREKFVSHYVNLSPDIVLLDFWMKDLTSELVDILIVKKTNSVEDVIALLALNSLTKEQEKSIALKCPKKVLETAANEDTSRNEKIMNAKKIVLKYESFFLADDQLEIKTYQEDWIPFLRDDVFLRLVLNTLTNNYTCFENKERFIQYSIDNVLSRKVIETVVLHILDARNFADFIRKYSHCIPKANHAEMFNHILRNNNLNSRDFALVCSMLSLDDNSKKIAEVTEEKKKEEEDAEWWRQQNE